MNSSNKIKIKSDCKQYNLIYTYAFYVSVLYRATQ